MPEQFLAYIQVVAIVGTGLGVLKKLNDFTVRLETMIKNLSKKSRNHDKRIKRLEKATKGKTNETY